MSPVALPNWLKTTRSLRYEQYSVDYLAIDFFDLSYELGVGLWWWLHQYWAVALTPIYCWDHRAQTHISLP